MMFHVKQPPFKTPYLALNLDVLEKNVRSLADLARKNGTVLRPHCKSHKTLEIAQLQMKEGADGITASTLKEIRYLAQGGIPSVTLAYPLVDAYKLREFLDLEKTMDLRTIVISKEHGRFLNDHVHTSSPLKVYLKVDTGLGRLGVSVEEIQETLTHLKTLPQLKVIGLLTHGGQSYKGELGMEAYATQESARLLEHRRSDLTISCGSTPTIRPLLKIQGVDEGRPGNYVFFDRTMLNLGVCSLEDCSLTIRTTVLSVSPKRLVVDAGSKALSSDGGVHGNQTLKGYGMVMEGVDLLVERLSEEHGIITGKDLDRFSPGDILNILPNHACSAVNLHDEMAVFKEGLYLTDYIIRGRGH